MMRRTTLVAAVALLLASCGSDTDEGQDAQPTGAPQASASVSTATGSPTASPTPEPNVVLPSDLVGRWTGDVVDPGWEQSALHATEYERTVWSITVTLQECYADGRCGYETMATQDFGLVGGPYECRYDLYYVATDSGTNTTTFDEYVVLDASGPVCLGVYTRGRAALTPRPDGETLRFRGGIYGTEYGPRGVLQRTSGP